MNLIPESSIDIVIDNFENGTLDYENIVEVFAEQQPVAMSFLLSDNEGALSDDEQDYLLYLAIILWQAVLQTNPNIKQVSPEEIAEAEEKNWSFLNETSTKPFRDRLDIFFENYPQEDLLAFVEDSVTGDADLDEEDSFQLTPEGQEPMFIVLKTLIDVLTA